MAQDADASPMAIIHSSYYAMFHAARAVLFQVTGRAPKRHDQAIQHFGLLVRDLDDAVRAAGKAFNEVKDERTAADYDETIRAVVCRSARCTAGGDRFPRGLRCALRISAVSCGNVLIVLEERRPGYHPRALAADIGGWSRLPTRNWAAPQDIMVCSRDQPQIGTRHCRISESHHRIDPCAIRTDVNVPDQGSWCRTRSYSGSCCRRHRQELRT
jgi:HEPN domain